MQKILAIILVCINCQTFQIENPPPPFVYANTYARVKLKSNLVLKESPNLNSVSYESISIPDNYILLTRNRTDFREIINGFEDYWYEVEYKDKRGWVFGKMLDISDEETNIIRYLNVMETNPNLSNFKKVKKYFDDNFKKINYEEAIEKYGKPIKEQKYTLSNHHGGFNRYLELEYSDIRLKFIDKNLFEYTLFNTEKLNINSRYIFIGSEWKVLEFEFGIPFSISKKSLIYSTCNPNFSDSCSGNYADNLEFKMENHRVVAVQFTKHVD